MKYSTSLIFIHILRFPCCQHSTQKNDQKTTLESSHFYDMNGNMYSLANIKQVWTAMIEKNANYQKTNALQVKELTIKVLKDNGNNAEQHVIFAYPNKKDILITSKLTVKNDHYILANEVAIFHNCTSTLEIALTNGQWILNTDKKQHKKIDIVTVI